jgi:hypothetical protein
MHGMVVKLANPTNRRTDGLWEKKEKKKKERDNIIV